MASQDNKKTIDDESTLVTVYSLETCSSANSPVAATKQRIRFCLSSNEMHHITHIDDMDETDVKETWYDKREYDAIKNKIIPVLRKMMKGEKIEENNKQTTRGLEYRTRQGAMRRQRNKVEAIAAVLEEQKRQRDQGILDDEKIREIYLGVGLPCQEAATELGLQDEVAVKKDLEKIRNQLNRCKADGKSKRGINGLFKQVRMRRLPIADDLTSMASTRVVGAAA